MELAADAALTRNERKKYPRAKRLVPTDGRTVLGKRVAELRQLFTSELAAGAGELTPIRKLKVEQAAHALALAERVRGRYMREGDGANLLDELIRAERRADVLLRRLGLPEAPAPAPVGPAISPLHAYLAGQKGAP